jgi:NADH-quinone oxidoreductase subunit C
MTATIAGERIAERLNAAYPDVVIEVEADSVTVPAERVVEIALFLRDDEELDCKYLNSLTAVDWLDHFDVVYHLSSLAKNHALVLKARSSHEMPIVPSVTEVWMGAHLQEREAYDLMGISFSDHPSLKRIFLWEGFPGHPLRKDFLALPGGFKPGLQRFPFEFPEGQRNYPALQETEAPSAPAVPRLDAATTQAAGMGSQQPGSTLEDATPGEEPQGAGRDVSQAGGTSPDPADSGERGHADSGAGEGPAREDSNPT